MMESRRGTTVEAMTETRVKRVAWRRRGLRRQYVGDLVAGDAGIRLSGRDAASGLDITLSIPRAEFETAHVSRSADEALAGERAVVLELAKSDAILLRELGAGPRGVHALARRLAALATH
jgi:hypothetical protein